MVELQPSKLAVPVRSRSPAPRHETPAHHQLRWVGHQTPHLATWKAVDQVHVPKPRGEVGDMRRGAMVRLARPEASLPDGHVVAAVPDRVLGENPSNAMPPRPPETLSLRHKHCGSEPGTVPVEDPHPLDGVSLHSLSLASLRRPVQCLRRGRSGSGMAGRSSKRSPTVTSGTTCVPRAIRPRWRPA